MELQFSKEVRPCLHYLVSQVQSQEQTQEVKLPDGMPDIGRVLGAWGQVLIRGKEWRSTGMTVSGGVLGWALYAPEDGSEVRVVDTWIPFQMKWEFPETLRDGTIHVWPLLSSMDARCISARKLLIRCVVSVQGEAMEPASCEMYTPTQVPEDVQLLKNTYPMVLPVEAGEKQFLIQEDLEPGGDVRQIMRFDIKLQLNEHRVMANRLVFRGIALLHMLCSNMEGKLFAWEKELSFSQFAELDGNFSDHANAAVRLVATALELERDEQGGLLLKCGVTAQYVIRDRVMVLAVEDGYSPHRTLELRKEVCDLPAQLDTVKGSIALEGIWKGEGKHLDAAFYCEHPQLRKNGSNAQFRIPGQFQLLYVDSDGLIQGAVVKAEDKLETVSDQGNRLDLYWQAGSVASEPGVDGLLLRQELQTELEVSAVNGLAVVSGIQLGEIQEMDPNRPALILRRVGCKRLWDIAKDSGSTVEAILGANNITEEPENDMMLLIPVS